MPDVCGWCTNGSCDICTFHKKADAKKKEDEKKIEEAKKKMEAEMK